MRWRLGRSGTHIGENSVDQGDIVVAPDPENSGIVDAPEIALATDRAQQVPEPSSATAPAATTRGDPDLLHDGTARQLMTPRNAKVGVEYEAKVPVEDLENLRITRPESDTGLQFDQSTSTLKGTPVVPGDVEWVMSGSRDGSSVAVTVRLTVIPDPRSLWRNLANPGAPYPKDDTHEKSLDGEVYIVGASKRGRAHAHEGLFRDDDFELVLAEPGGWHIVAVADGAGSARYSREGSKWAVDYVRRELPVAMATKVSPRMNDILEKYEADQHGCTRAVRLILYEAMVRVAFDAAREIEGKARNRGDDLGDYSTTLIMCAVRRIGDGWFISSFSVGDGGAALLDIPGGTVKVLTTPDAGDYAGQTRFLRTSEFADNERSLDRIHFAIRPSFTSLTLMTDGISDAKFPTDSALADFSGWKAFWEEDLTRAVTLSRDNSQAGKELLEWLDFWSEGNHDDRTIAVLLP